MMRYSLRETHVAVFQADTISPETFRYAPACLFDLVKRLVLPS